MSDFYIRKFDYPIYYQMHALRHHGIIHGLAVFKWYWYGMRVDRCYGVPGPRTSKQQGWRGVFYDAVYNWHQFDSETKHYYDKLNYPVRVYGYHRYLRLYLRAAQKMITYWEPLEKSVSDNSSPETFISSQYFAGAQRIRSLSQYPTNPEYGAIVYKNDLKKFYGYHEDAGWDYLAPASGEAPGTDTRVATVIVAADGTGDFTDIQDGIDELPADGGDVFIKNGTYTITATIQVDVSNVRLIGMGSATIIKTDTECEINAITIGSGIITPDNVKILGIKFDGNKANQTHFVNGQAINMATNNSNVEIDHCIFLNQKGFTMQQIGVATNLKITNNYMTGGSSLLFADVEGFTYSNNYFNSACPTVLNFTLCNNGIITNNYFKNTSSGAGPIGSINAADGSNLVITDNTFDTPRYTGISLTGVDVFTIKGNYITGGQTGGIVIYSGTNFNIIGNQIISCNFYALYISTASNGIIEGNNFKTIDRQGINATALSSSVINGNTFQDMSQETANTYDDIYFDTTCVRNVVSGNMAYEVAANKARYLFKENNANDDYNRITSNIGIGQATGKYLVAGANTIVDEYTDGVTFITHGAKHRPGGADPIPTVNTLKKTGNQTINSGAATFVDIDDLTFPVVNGTDYAFYFYITFQSAATTTGHKFGVNCPTGTLDFWAYSQIIANGAAGVATHTQRHNVTRDDMTLLTATVTQAVDLAVIIQGRYKCTQSGTFAARFANELSANTDLVVQKGSWGFWF